MNLKTKMTANKIRNRLADEAYADYMAEMMDDALSVLEYNYLYDNNMFMDLMNDDEKLRKKVLKSIDIRKLEKILPKYIKRNLVLKELTKTERKEIWNTIKK